MKPYDEYCGNCIYIRGAKPCEDCKTKNNFKPKQIPQAAPEAVSAEFALLDGKRQFTMMLEPHTPTKPGNACQECVLAHGPMCIDRSYCEYPKTGKTWKKAI